MKEHEDDTSRDHTGHELLQPTSRLVPPRQTESDVRDRLSALPSDGSPASGKFQHQSRLIHNAPAAHKTVYRFIHAIVDG